MSKNQKVVWRFPKPMPPMVEWSRLKRYRQMKGIKLVELALKAGISPNTLFHHELGFPGSPEVRAKICAVLNITESQVYPVKVLGDTVIESGEKLTIEVTG